MSRVRLRTEGRRYHRDNLHSGHCPAVYYLSGEGDKEPGSCARGHTLLALSHFRAMEVIWGQLCCLDLGLTISNVHLSILILPSRTAVDDRSAIYLPCDCNVVHGCEEHHSCEHDRCLDGKCMVSKRSCVLGGSSNLILPN